MIFIAPHCSGQLLSFQRFNWAHINLCLQPAHCLPWSCSASSQGCVWLKRQGWEDGRGGEERLPNSPDGDAFTYSHSEWHHLTDTPELCIWNPSDLVIICSHLQSFKCSHLPCRGWFASLRKFSDWSTCFVVGWSQSAENGPGPTVWRRERYIQIEINHKSLIHHHDSCENILPSPLPLLPSLRPLRSFHIPPLKRTNFWKAPFSSLP